MVSAQRASWFIPFRETALMEVVATENRQHSLVRIHHVFEANSTDKGGSGRGLINSVSHEDIDRVHGMDLIGFLPSEHLQFSPL